MREDLNGPKIQVSMISTKKVRFAIKAGDTKQIEEMLREGLNLNAALTQNWTLLHLAAKTGQASMVALEMDGAETRYSQELADTSTPEQLFEKQWALTLLESVLKRLRGDYARDGKSALFEALEPCLVGSREGQPYAELAAEVGMTEGAVKVAVCRPARAASVPGVGKIVWIEL